jgi:hypothetical protein
MKGCHLPFQSEKAFGYQDVQIHAAYTEEGWKIPSRRLTQTWTRAIERTDEESSGERREGRNDGRESRADREERWIVVQPEIAAVEAEVERMEER